MSSKPSKWEERAALTAATAGFVGYWPLGPGTAGTLVALPLLWAMAVSPVLFQIAFAGALFAVGVWSAERAKKPLKRHDAPQIVIDEVVGFFVTMIAVPFSLYWLVCGFCLFRLLDIFKPFPISWIDKHVKGGWGVMLDDLLAGIFANGVMHLMMRAAL